MVAGILMVAVWSVALAVAGCTSPLAAVGSPQGLTITGQAESGVGGAVKLTGDFSTAYYSYTDANTVTFVLLDGPEDSPTQAAVVRLFWRPRAGRTPLEPTATNVTIQYLVFAGRGNASGDGQVGVYTGAGFLMPSEKPGATKLSADFWNATLQLDTRTDLFRDLLGQATLTGSFTAKRDEAKVNALLRQLGREASRRLGFPRMVRGGVAGKGAGGDDREVTSGRTAAGVARGTVTTRGTARGTADGIRGFVVGCWGVVPGAVPGAAPRQRPV